MLSNYQYTYWRYSHLPGHICILEGLLTAHHLGHLRRRMAMRRRPLHGSCCCCCKGCLGAGHRHTQLAGQGPGLGHRRLGPAVAAAKQLGPLGCPAGGLLQGCGDALSCQRRAVPQAPRTGCCGGKQPAATACTADVWASEQP
jgi:hypothetical protein